MDEVNYCESCFNTKTNLTVVDYIENPFATCADCEAAAEDEGCLLATKAA